MARTPQLLDHRGRPVRRSDLTQEVAGPTLTGIRSPIMGYPGDGLDPVRLAGILRAADMGDPLQTMELAETIEERDLHYTGVLGTRKRSVSQIPISVEAASNDQHDKDIAKRVEDWLRRDELTGELFDILDAVGKGYSFTEIIWDSSGGQWEPVQLKDRSQRWFTFDRTDLDTPLMRDERGAEVSLPAYKFIEARFKAKTGLIARSGLSRIVMWAYLFKKYTERDWAIFTQTFGQPLRVGKFGPGASENDKKTLFQAVANIAGDCAAIIPNGMEIDFVEAANLGTGHTNYRERADWLDQQVSKAVLGQTTTTDAISGGHAVSEEHREVQKDIERADAIHLQGFLNRDLIRPWVDLEFGPQKRYPRLIIARPEPEDLVALGQSLGALVAMGLEVPEVEVRSRFGWRAPAAGEKILGKPAENPPEPTVPTEDVEQTSILKQQNGPLKYLSTQLGPTPYKSTHSRSEGRSAPQSETDLLTDRLEDELDPIMQALMEELEAMTRAAGSLPELQEMLLAKFPELATDDLVEKLAQGMSAAEAGGWVLTEEEAGD